MGPRGRTKTNVYFVGSGTSWALIDTGRAKDAPSIRQAAESVFGVRTRPVSILLTHFHPDHPGSVLQLARIWDCAVYLYPDELPLATGDLAALSTYAGWLDAWVVLPLMRAMGRGRPRLYCSTKCRSTNTRGGVLGVEVNYAGEDGGRPTGRVWVVKIRRGRDEVVVATELGRPSADHLTGQMSQLINGHRRAKRGVMERKESTGPSGGLLERWAAGY